MKIGIIGGGIVGLNSGVVLAEAGHDVVIYSKDDYKAITSWAAGATCCPFGVEPSDQINEWFAYNNEILDMLSRDEEAGVSWRPWRKVSSTGELPEYFWQKHVRNFRIMKSEECTEAYPAAMAGDMLLMDVDRYYPYLLKRFEDCGGRIVSRVVDGFSELAFEHDVIVNACGIYADDPAVVPARGQIVLVENPGLETLINSVEGTHYIFPRSDVCLLGGSFDEGEWNMEPDEDLTRRIMDWAVDFEPRLKGMPILDVRVGLRPLRPEVRLEREVLADGTPVVHNYGHGGAGYTTSWGCARDVLQLIGRV